jgi:Homocysteine S-methyltransferase
VTPLFTSLNGGDEEKIPLIVYPNSGEVFDSTTGWSGVVVGEPIEAFIPEWLELGAKFVGGCCRTYARNIERIKETVTRLQSTAEHSWWLEMYLGDNFLKASLGKLMENEYLINIALFIF